MSSFQVGAGARRVECGTITDLHEEGTLMAWIYPTNVALYGIIAAKQESGFADYLSFAINSGGGIEIEHARNSGFVRVRTSTQFTVNEWGFGACVWEDTGTASDQKGYLGDLTTLATEGSYSSQTHTTGWGASDGGRTWSIGNYVTDPAWGDFPGRIAFVGFWNRKMTLGEIQAQQFRPHPTSGCVGMWFPFLHGTASVPDLSGSGQNSSSITGATLADGCPAIQHLGFDTYSPYVVAAGSSVPVFYHHYRQMMGA